MDIVNSFSYKQRLLDVQSAVNRVQLPTTTFRDLLKGIFYGVVKYAVKQDASEEPIDSLHLYHDLVMYGIASVTVRNSGGKFSEYFAVINQVARLLDPEWDSKKEEAQKISKKYDELAEYVEEEQPEFEFFFGVPSMIGIGFLPALTKLTIPLDKVVFCVMLFGAASGLTLGVLNDLSSHAKDVRSVFTEIKQIR